MYEVVARNLDATAGGIRDRIESALTKFCQGTPAADDITLVMIQFDPAQARSPTEQATRRGAA